MARDPDQDTPERRLAREIAMREAAIAHWAKRGSAKGREMLERELAELRRRQATDARYRAAMRRLGVRP